MLNRAFVLFLGYFYGFHTLFVGVGMVNLSHHLLKECCCFGIRAVRWLVVGWRGRTSERDTFHRVFGSIGRHRSRESGDMEWYSKSCVYILECVNVGEIVWGPGISRDITTGTATNNDRTRNTYEHMGSFHLHLPHPCSP